MEYIYEAVICTKLISLPLSLISSLWKVVLMFWADWNQPSKATYWDLAIAKKDEAVFCQLDFDKFKVCDCGVGPLID